MLVKSHSHIIQKTDYLQNLKTGNGFILRSQILINGKVFNTLPVHNLTDLIHNITVGYKDRKLKCFKFISIENNIPVLNSKDAVAFITFPRVLTCLYQSRPTDRILKLDSDVNKWRISLNQRPGSNLDNKDQTHFYTELEWNSKAIFEYAVVTRLLSGGYDAGDFISKTEQSFIDNFKSIAPDKQTKYYERLKKEMAESIG